MNKGWRVFGLSIGFLILFIVGSSIIFDVVFLIIGEYPNMIIRFIIAFIFLNILLKFTWFGEEIDNNLKKLIKKFFIKKKNNKKDDKIY